MRATLLVVAAVLSFSIRPLHAQVAARAHEVGIGVTIPDVGLFVPINVSAHVRVEPYVNFQSSRADYPITADTLWSSFALIGLGIFSVVHPQEHFSIYFGPRVGLLRGSRKENGGSGQGSSDDSGWFVAGAVGGEYSPAPRFSLGAEAKVQYDHSSSSASGAFNVGPTLFAHSWFSSSAFVVRFYP